MKDIKIYRLTEKVMEYSEDSVSYRNAYDFAERFYRYTPVFFNVLVHVDTDDIAREGAHRLQSSDLSIEDYTEENAVPTLATWEYMYYLKKALIKNGIIGCRYSLIKVRNNRICLYIEDNHWIVSIIKKQTPIITKTFREWQIWDAVFAFIDLVTKDEKKRRKIWEDFGTDANWAEKMSDSPVPTRIIDDE